MEKRAAAPCCLELIAAGGEVGGGGELRAALYTDGNQRSVVFTVFPCTSGLVISAEADVCLT